MMVRYSRKVIVIMMTTTMMMTTTASSPDMHRTRTAAEDDLQQAHGLDCEKTTTLYINLTFRYFCC